MKKLFLITIASIILIGCGVKPIGQLVGNELVSNKIIISGGVQHAMSNLEDGIRYCGSRGGNFLLPVDYGKSKCSPVRENGTATCDMNVIMGENHYSYEITMGLIDFKPLNKNETEVHLKIRNTGLGNKHMLLKVWEKYIDGSYKMTCPNK